MKYIYINENSNMSEEVKLKKWLRPLRPVEEMYARAQPFNALMTGYLFSINSKNILKEEEVMSTLSHLFR